MKAALTAALVMLVVASAAASPGKKGGSATLVPAAELKWTAVPDTPGIRMAVAEGDPMKGPSHFFVRFEPGTSVPAHHHSADHYVSVISGTMVLNVDGKDQMLPAGSYFAFVGKKPHGTRCDAGAPCVLMIDARGKWDVVPEGKDAEATR